MSEEAMRQALEALELSAVTVDSFGVQQKTQEAITTLREALTEQPAQQEPVTDEENEKFSRDVSNFKGTDEAATMYALEKFLKGRMAPQPAQRKPLTDEQISEIVTASTGWRIPQSSHYSLARAIEAAHGIKEKNT